MANGNVSKPQVLLIFRMSPTSIVESWWIRLQGANGGKGPSSFDQSAATPKPLFFRPNVSIPSLREARDCTSRSLSILGKIWNCLAWALAQVKSNQRASAPFAKTWRSYCDSHGDGFYDPARLSDGTGFRCDRGRICVFSPESESEDGVSV